MEQQFIPYPTGTIKLILRIPLALHRAGLGWLVSLFPVMLLTTRGRKSGQPRTVVLEFRRHGSKFYVLSAWGARPHWYQNLLHDPHATVTIGRHTYSVCAQPVRDEGEALRALVMFRRRSPFFYDPVLARLSSATKINLKTLADVAGEFTLMRLDIVQQPLPLPPIRQDRAWVSGAVLASSAVLGTLALITRPRLPSAPTPTDH